MKAASRTLMKLTPGNISEILNSTFLRRIGRSNKKFYDNVIGIWLPVFISQDETSHHRKEGELPQYHQPPKPHQHEVQVQEKCLYVIVSEIFQTLLEKRRGENSRGYIPYRFSTTITKPRFNT